MYGRCPGPRQDEILSEMRHGLVQTNYRMSVKITWTMFSHTILSGLEQDNLELTSQLDYKELFKGVQFIYKCHFNVLSLGIMYYLGFDLRNVWFVGAQCMTFVG